MLDNGALDTFTCTGQPAIEVHMTIALVDDFIGLKVSLKLTQEVKGRQSPDWNNGVTGFFLDIQRQLWIIS